MAASYNIIVRATSSDTSFSTQSFTIAITDVNEFSVGSVSDTNASANSVVENATIGTTVGITASADDGDATNSGITYSLQNNDGGRFTIDANTGVVTVAGAINRETDGASRSITVRALSQDGSFTDQIFSISIVDANEFAVSTPTDTNASANSIAENSANGTLVGITANAFDSDATTNTVTYLLDDSAGGRFTIDANTGVVTVANSSLLNYESATSHSITVRANSVDGSSSTQTFTITLTDVNEFATSAVTDSNAAADSVAENASIGTTVGITGYATDLDGTATITYSLDNSAGGLFTIDANSGVVTVAGAIDRETAASYNITVRATSSDTSFSTQSFTIAVSDVDEFNVGSVSDTNASANSVVENATIGTVVGITASASDGDATNSGITYSLQNNDGGRFTIDANTGVVTVAGAINRETDGASRSITVRALSQDGSFTDQIFSISIVDANEFAVTTPTDTNAAANSIAENSANGTLVGITANAFDNDATTNTVTYLLDDSAGGRFTIDANTGVVTVANSSLLDYESATSHTITVRANSVDGSSSTQTFTISLTDVNESPISAVSDTDGATDVILENSSIGATVGITGHATDSDGTDTITYSLDNNAGGRFAIDANSGVVTVAGAIDREAAASYNIVIRATSSDTSFSTQSFTIAVSDVDEFNVGTVSDTNASANSVVENATIGTVVGITASASDGDATNSGITYSLQNNDGGRFTIDANTGVVTVAGAINRETDGASRSITVRALSQDGSFTDQVFSIGIVDANEFAITTPTDTNAAANSIAENSANGTLVGITANAFDSDATTNTVTYLLDDSAGGRFTIDANTGVVTVANSSLLNYESATSHTITVRANSVDGSSSTQTFTISLTDVNESPVSAVSDTDGATDVILENSSIGATVGITGHATDSDGTDTITYSLDNNAGGRFAIDANSGVVTVAGAIDREAAASYNIVIRATSSDTSFSTQSFTIAVSDVDEFNVDSVSDTNATANSVVENASVGTVVGITASASDADATNSGITYSLQNNDGGRFTIDANTGVVTVAGAINRETDGASRSITVRALSQDGSFTDQNFTIAIVDANEFAITTPTDTNAAANSIAENSASGTLVGITANAFDSDATTNTITYTLDDDAGGRFAIDINTGVVTVANSSLLNYESATSHAITVRAHSTDGSSAVQNFTIQLTDVNEFAISAVSDSDAGSDHVAENASAGTTVGITGHAVDLDGTASVTYSLDDDAGGRFTIDANTGVVTVAGAIDRETAASYNITVRATSSDLSTSTQTYTIVIDDVDEFNVGPVSDTNATANSVVENATIGTVVGITASASDADATTSGITYSLQNNDGGRFTIDANTGVVTVAGTINRETDGPTRSITVRALSQDGSFTDQNFTIAIVDANEFAITTPTDTNAAANSVAENSATGTVVGVTANAFDSDATNSTVTYTLDDDAGGRFAIDISTGVVTVADGSLLNFEATTSHSITVRATSLDGSSSTQSFTIQVTDINESAVSPVVDSNSATNVILENSSIGSTVGITASASDADGTDTVTYTLDNDAGGRFAIDANSGVVTVAGAIDREAAASYNITIRATSSDLSFTTQSFTIAVDDVDEFNVGAVSDTNATANSVVENASIGTVVGITASASDADATNSGITYSLQNNDGGRFTIDANTGVVTVAGAINRETDGASRSITVRALSQDGSFTDQNFTITIVDANEFAITTPTDTNAAANSIAENSVNGTLVGITANAFDSDATTNTITYTLDDDAGGRFAIDINTGVVTVANSSLLNFESATSHAITVRAHSTDGSSAVQNFTIQLTDVNEYAISAVSDTDAGPDHVAENAAIGTTVGITGHAVDLDGTASVTYSLDNDAGGLFEIDANTGVVTVAGAIDREVAASYNITIRATSNDSSFTTQSYTIAVDDVDEFNVGAVSDTNATANSVVENATVGTAVGITASANDADATTSGITYTLHDNDGGRFTIDANTGVVTVASAINRETDGPTRSITVRATSQDGSFTDQNFNINIVDANEFSASTPTDNNSATNSVNENAANGTAVGITAMRLTWMRPTA